MSNVLIRFAGQLYQGAQSPKVKSNCNTITFFNRGVDDITVDGTVLSTGESFTDMGWPGELNTSTYVVQQVTTVGPLMLYVRRKFYQ